MQKPRSWELLDTDHLVEVSRLCTGVYAPHQHV